MRTSERGKKMIVKYEGLVPYAYDDPVGHATFGVGHLIHRGRCQPEDYANFGSKARQKPQARARAWNILSNDLQDFESGVRQHVRVKLNQNEFDALVSFAFNVGLGALEGSSLLRELNAGHRFKAGLHFLDWDKGTIAGRIVRLLGLTRRRNAERRRFRSKFKAGKRRHA